MNLAIELDSTFVEGSAAAISALIIFCGGVFFLLTIVTGARLAYFITASVTLGFLLIMAVIWSLPVAYPETPLGPVDKLPQWDPVDVVKEGEPLDGPSADAYPDAPWRKIDPEDQQEVAKAGELGSGALDAVKEGIEAGDLPSSAEANTADADSVRFLEVEGDEYGALLLEPPPEGEDEDAPTIAAIMRFDPGNPQETARRIAGGTLILLIGHLFFLSRSEKRARAARQEQ